MRLWTNIFLPIKSPLEFLLPCKDETIVRKLNDTHKTNDSLLLPSAFADWVSGKLSLCLAADGVDKSQKPLEIRTFRQKSTAILIRFVSKLRCFLWRRGSRTPSENTSSGTSPGADGCFYSRAMPQTVMLHGLVASWVMPGQSLPRSRAPLRSCPSPARGPSGEDSRLIKQRQELRCRCS